MLKVPLAVFATHINIKGFKCFKQYPGLQNDLRKKKSLKTETK